MQNTETMTNRNPKPHLASKFHRMFSYRAAFGYANLLLLLLCQYRSDDEDPFTKEDLADIINGVCANSCIVIAN